MDLKGSSLQILKAIVKSQLLTIEAFRFLATYYAYSTSFSLLTNPCPLIEFRNKLFKIDILTVKQFELNDFGI